MCNCSFAQWSTSTNGIYYNQYVGIGTSPSASLHIYKAQAPLILMQNSVSRLNIGLATNLGDYAGIATPGDAVIRAFGNSLIFYQPNNANNGKTAIRFGDEYNGCVMSIFNNKNIQMDAHVRALDMTIANDLNIGDYNANWSGYGKKLILSGIGDGTDDIWLAKYCRENNKTDLRINIGDDNGDDDRFIIGNNYCGDNLWHNRFVVTNSGRVGINVDNPTSALEVNGTIRSKEVKIEATGWADFVFDKNYNLPSLSEVENHINTYNCLPDIPSEKVVKEQGVDIGNMQVKLLQKIEELTLYTIKQDKQIQTQSVQIQQLNKAIAQMQKEFKNKQ